MTISDRISQILAASAGRGTELLFAFVVDSASRYFEQCPEDFCLQSYSEDVIVFGGTNRVVWSIRRGFRVDRSYCTERFLAHADQLDR